MSTATPIAQIRPFKPADDKLVRFVIGKANMESLAVANRRGYAHPLTVSAWLVLSGILIDFMRLWPTDRHGLVGYLTPIPPMAAMAVPIMFLIDWLNRPYFEQQVQVALRGADLSDISNYYSRSASSGFWILDYGDQFVGLIALDAYQESLTTPPSFSTTTKAIRNRKQSQESPGPGAASAATIRHFYVDEAYRTSGIQADLLTHAVQVAFGADPALQRINAPDSSLIPYIRECLREAGFKLDCVTGKVGVYRWTLGQRTLERGGWKNRPKDE